MTGGGFTRAELREWTSGWWLLFVVGVLSVVAGLILLFKPSDSLATLAVVAGIFVLVQGIMELMASFRHGTQNRGLVAVAGVLSAIVGILLIRHPIAGVAAIGLFIGIWLVAIGVVRLVVGFDAPGQRTWNFVVGALEIIAGIVIVASPDIGFATLALLAGIAFIVNGIGLIGLGRALHNVRRGAA